MLGRGPFIFYILYLATTDYSTPALRLFVAFFAFFLRRLSLAEKKILAFARQPRPFATYVQTLGAVVFTTIAKSKTKSKNTVNVRTSLRRGLV